MISYTTEQENAMKANGTVLVAAAAGSGKTAVLVERILRRFCNENAPLMADRALIVTFTNAAAIELRQKIEKGLKKKLANNPNSDLIKRQNLLIQNASICTIDSFCINLVRENFNFLGISHDFKIADTNSIEFIKDEILDKLFLSKYEEKNENFTNLLKKLKRGYDDSNIKNIIKNIYEKSCSMPYPELWLKAINNAYNDPFSDSLWKDMLLEELLEDFIDINDKYETLMMLSNKEPKLYDSLKEYNEQLLDIKNNLENKNWDNVLNLANVLPNLSVTKKKFGDDFELMDFAKLIVEKVKKFKENTEKYLQADEKTISKSMENFSAIIGDIVSLVLDYKNAIDEYSKENNSYTFYQIEQMALKLIDNENAPVLENFNNQFDEILVDEYQDTSNLQDELFRLLSAKNNQLFMVGDVKQSIYGFRNANPDNFLKRKDSYPDFIEGNNKESKVLLSGNFRSRKNICKFINYIFRAFMTKSDADMEYDSAEALKPLGNFLENNEENDVEIFALDNAESTMSAAQYEATCVAEYILDTMKKEPFLDDGKGDLRKAQFNDFAILMRSPKNKIGEYVEVLHSYGIPVNSPSEKYCESIEIKTALSLLKTINNPNDNIALFGVLTSVLFGFSEDEIANIRITDKYATLYANLLSCKDANKKVNDFLEFLNWARITASTETIDKLLIKVFNKTSIIDIFNTFENGNLKKANLYMFIEHSEKFVTAGDRSITEFIKYIESDVNNALAANVVNSSNAVQLMSIHNSKGLQFPICILCSLATKFNMMDTTNDCIVDDKLGTAFRYYDEDLNSIVKPVSHTCLSLAIKAKLLKEELRLLYVALTRAKEKLALFITKSNIGEYIEKCKISAKSAGANGIPFSKNSIYLGNSYADWLMIALMHDRLGKLQESDEWNCNYSFEFIAPRNSKVEIKENEEKFDQDLPNLKEIFDYKYPYELLNSVPAKTSVTDILKKKKILSGGFASTPAFLSEKGLTPAQIGTATHKFMEFCDFKRASEDIDSEIERLAEWKYITNLEAEAIDKESIKEFFNSYVYDYVVGADRVYNEYRFITKIPCNKINPEISESIEDSTLVQGVADCVIIKDNRIIIVDYKTDNSKSKQYFIDEYSYQLNLYADALTKIFSLPIEKKIIYSFKMRECIEV